jgi:hypothetical protein
MKMGISSEEVIAKAISIVDAAKAAGIELRVMGALAVRIHSKGKETLHKKLKRLGSESATEFTDIDLMSIGNYRASNKDFFEKLGFVPDRDALAFWNIRQIYNESSTKIHVDLFFDSLDMCHKIEFKDVLKLDYPTIPLAELLLEKMQIVEINEKDLKDSTALIEGHDIGQTDNEQINGARISKLLAKDWGFYYTVTTNLKKLKDRISIYELTAEETKIIASRIDKLLDLIEKEPKTTGWKIRAKVGTKKKWYQDVEEVIR